MDSRKSPQVFVESDIRMKMDNIKRILWIDDIPENIGSSMFPDGETKNVSTMDEAIDEIAGPHLYDYDTIVLDIDFENGLPNGEKNVVEKLSKKIFLKEDQREKRFIINNGGYLLFLYLLEKGYPSDQVAFLTGHGTIIGQLKRYTSQNLLQLSKQEIKEKFVSAWKDFGDSIDDFENQIDALPIDVEYKTSDFVLDCAAALGSKNYTELEQLINGINPSTVTGSIQNTGDMVIFRFHEANLEAPAYFSKRDNDIDGHNLKDAEKWMKSRRSEDNVTRWLVLDAANYVEMLFRDDQKKMEDQIGGLFQNISTDPGIRSAFRQMFFVFDGLRNIKRRGIYYQAVSAMLIPFDSTPKNSGSSIAGVSSDYKKVQTMFLRLSKQARNYCAHNFFGSSLKNDSVLYIIACTLLGILSKEQAQIKASWFENTYTTISRNITYSAANNLTKIDNLCQTLLNENRVDTNNAHVSDNYSSYNSWEMLRALGYNKDMSISSQPSTSIREEYYIFTLAAYIVKWFEGLPEIDVESNQGYCTSIVYKISNEIVAGYIYPGIT